MKSYLPIIASLFLVSTPLVLPATASETEIVATEINPYIKDNIALEISVKITSDDNSGSGVIIAQDDDTYLVLTNNHVLRDGNEFAIATHDGITHQATFVENGIATDDDLALLEFTSDRSYQTATINTAATPRVEQTILAVGYSAETGELVTEAGKIERVPDKSFKEGYSIGYSSNVVGGMSGGAIINTDGEVIGINGKGAFPIINTGYDLEDGTKPSAEEIEQYRKLSWGLSINRLLTRVNPEIITAYSLPLPETADSIESPELTGWLGELEAKAKQITVRIDSSSGANGSGVIIAKEGNTYTVLTADHVICESEPKSRDCIDYSYDLLAPDGQKYPVNIETIKRQEGVDLATVRFTSNQNYQVAELANYPLRENDAVFVAGYPKLNQDTPAQWLFSLGYGLNSELGLLGVNDNSLKNDSSGLPGTQGGSLAGGYEMVYTSITYGGMSGGAVLDKDGRVIGIHGLAEGQTALDSQSGLATQIQLGYSLGIPVNTLISLADKLGMPELSVQENRAKALDTREAESFVAATLGTEISEGNAKPELWLERGNQLWRLRRYTEAVEAFDRTIAFNPEFLHLAHYGRSLALIYDVKSEAALASLELATEIKPSFVPAFYYKSILLSSLNRWESALVAIKTAISLQPDNANYYNQKGAILEELKRYQAAEAAYNEGLEINPHHGFYVNRGLVYDKQGKLELALSDYDKAIAIEPNFAPAYNGRGNVYDKQGKLELALSDYDKAIAIEPNFAPAYNGRGNVYNEQGKLELALSDYDKAIAIEPNDALAYNGRGNVYNEQGKLELALSDYDKAIAIEPNDALAYNGRGNVYSKQGKLELALSDYDKAIAIEPNDSPAYNGRGNVYDKQGKLKLALSDYERAIAIDSNFAFAYVNRGNLYGEQGKLKLALSDLERALTIDPNFAGAYNGRGIIYFKQQDFDSAIDAFTQAIEFDPQYAEAYRFRGAVYLIQEKHYLAIGDLNKAVEISPNDAEAHKLLGATYTNAGDINAGISSLKKAQQLFIAQGNSQEEEETKAMLQHLSQPEQSESAQASEPNPNPANKFELTYDTSPDESIDRDSAEAQYLRGVTYFQQQDFDSAIDAFTQAIEIDPEHAEAYRLRGIIYTTQKKHDLAIGDLNKVVKISPNDANAHQLLGMAYLTAGNTEATISNLEKAQQLSIAQGDDKTAKEISKLLEIFK